MRMKRPAGRGVPDLEGSSQPAVVFLVHSFQSGSRERCDSNWPKKLITDSMATKKVDR